MTPKQSGEISFGERLGAVTAEDWTFMVVPLSSEKTFTNITYGWGVVGSSNEINHMHIAAQTAAVRVDKGDPRLILRQVDGAKPTDSPATSGSGNQISKLIILQEMAAKPEFVPTLAAEYAAAKDNGIWGQPVPAPAERSEKAAAAMATGYRRWWAAGASVPAIR